MENLVLVLHLIVLIEDVVFHNERGLIWRTGKSMNYAAN
jgi:hypothetical protein